MNISLVIVVAYLFLMFAAGFLLTKRSRSTSELFVGEKTLSLFLLVPLIFGEVIAGSSTTGTAQGGYTQGISAIWVFVGKGLGSIAFALLLVKFFDEAGKSGAMSLPEAFKWRFDGKVRLVMTIVFLVPMGLICAAQCKALASLLGPMIGMDTAPLIVFAALAFGCLGLAGVKGVAKMNVINSFVIFIGIAAVSMVCVFHVGGFNALFDRVPEGFGNLVYPNAWEIGGQFISGALAFFVTATPCNACYSTGNPRTSRSALAITGLLAAVFSLFPALIGLAGSVVLPGVDPNTILYSMPASVSPLLSGVVSMSVFAAVISTAPFFFLSFGTVVVRDIVLPIRPGLSDAQQMKMACASIVFFVVVVIMFGLSTTSIFGQIIGANHINACAGFLLVVSVFSRKLTNRAAFWSLLVSGALSIFWYFTGSVCGFAIEPLWPALVIETALMVLISLFDRNHRGKDFEEFEKRRREGLREYKERSALNC